VALVDFRRLTEVKRNRARQVEWPAKLARSQLNRTPPFLDPKPLEAESGAVNPVTDPADWTTCAT
jgi:hypothetical protein